MATKTLHYIGLLACIALAIACFSPWAYYADIKETFTGFYSFKNNYGKPGKLLLMISVICFSLMLLPKIWAKRTNLFVAALGVGYAIKSYILFSSCYNAYCPQKLFGIYLMLGASCIIMLATIFPHLTLTQTSTPEKKSTSQSSAEIS
jgi:hypothetical protein